jgi:D-alanine transfer protein
MRYANLVAVSLALCIIMIVIIVFSWYASAYESRSIPKLYGRDFNQKSLGSAIQTEAFKREDILPVYGGSELMATGNSLRPDVFFSNHWGGFHVFLTAMPGSNALIFLQNIAALGTSIRGKRLVISITPSPVFGSNFPSEYYSGNFSRLHVFRFILSDAISFDLKRDAARRMLEYPQTLRGDELLDIALNSLADESPWHRVLYYLILPLARLETSVLSLQDHWRTIEYLRQGVADSDAPLKQPADIEWSSLSEQAEQESRRAAVLNPFGFDDDFWRSEMELWESLGKRRVDWDERTFLDHLKQSTEWTDLDLLLRGLDELGAEPLILAAPLPGEFLDYLGVSPSLRFAYYRKLRAAVGSSGSRLVDFEDRDGDTSFLYDFYSHPSNKGLVAYDRALAAFYHGRLEDLGASAAVEPPPSPLAYWRLDETTGAVAHDAAGEHDGIYDAVRLGQPGPGQGQTNVAPEFDGWRSRVVTDESFDFAGRTPFSYEVWAYPEIADGSFRRVLSKDAYFGGANHGWALALHQDWLTFARHDAQGEGSVILAQSLPRFRWSHIVGTYDGMHMRLYRNGRVAGAAESSANLPDLSIPLTIGALGKQAEVFQGRISGVAIYDRALSDLDVGALFRARLAADQIPNSCPETVALEPSLDCRPP